MRPLAVLLCLVAFAAADIVVLKSGKRIEGRAIESGDEIIVNPYNSKHPKMVLGVRRFPRAKVKRIDRTLPSPAHEFHGRLAEAQDATACIELAEWCARNKLKKQRVWALERALRFDADAAVARKLLGSKAPKGRWGEQVDLARRMLAAPDSERAELVAEIRRDRAFPFSMRYLRRALRSTAAKRGYQRGRPVALRADKLKSGARYTLFVPDKYDPLTPTPLVIGLHGGGAGGADGKLVVGSGSQAMNFYQRRSDTRGWICACPTALQAGWGGGSNNDLIDAIIEELSALYNIDENRVYLVGHSMGGGGTWVQGSRTPERWAAIAPAASYGVRGLDAFGKTRTGFYVYHSVDDPRTRIGGVRPQMRSLPGSGKDFVYTELTDRGHAFPPEVIDDIFDFFALRRLARGPGRFKPTIRPRSSFLAKVSRDEKKYLPALPALVAGGSASAKPASLKSLIKKLKTGGGVAQQSVAPLVACKDPKTNAAVARVVVSSKADSGVRAYAARILGERKATAQVGALGRMLLIETETQALLAGLDALEQIGSADAGEPLLRFIEKRQAYLMQRARGDELDHSDWSSIVPPIARACELAATFKPKGAAKTIGRRVVIGILLSKIAVAYDRQNQNPLPTGRALAHSACGALARLGDPAGLFSLREMDKAAGSARGIPIRHLRGPVSVMSGWPKDQRIAADARSALRALSK